MTKNLLLKLILIPTVILICFLFSEIFLRVQTFVDLDIFKPLYPFHQKLHHGTDEFVVTDYGTTCNGEKIKLLLLGDSWMEEEGLSRTIEREFANKAGKCVQVINGGTGSYAPTLYLLKARQAFERYGKFDYIIVNIDETDVGDEWLRYRIATVRDTSGKIISVPYDHDLASQYILNGKLWAEDTNFYTVRLIKCAIYYKILVPFIYRPTFFPEYSSLMKYVFAPDARSLYPKELTHFESRLLEMATEILTYAPDASHVYVTHHPHYRGLADRVDSGKQYLPIVSEAIAWLKSKSGVNVLDARNFITQIHGETPLKNNYRKDDPFSHLAGDAEIRYGKWIVSQIEIK